MQIGTEGKRGAGAQMLQGRRGVGGRRHCAKEEARQQGHAWSGRGACGLIIVPACWVWSGGSSACPCVTAEGLIILKGAE